MKAINLQAIQFKPLNLKQKKIAGFCLVSYFVFLLILLPARVSFFWLPQSIQMSGLSGTLWKGRAETIRVGNYQLENVAWNIHLLSLFLLDFDVDVSLGTSKSLTRGQANISASFFGLRFTNIRLNTHLPLVLYGSALPYQTRLEGELLLLIQEYKLGAPYCETLSGRLEIDDMYVSNSFGNYMLGDVGLALGCDKGSLVGTMAQEDNKLGVQGQLQLSPNNQYSILGSVALVDTMPEDFKGLLPFLGEPDAQGRYPLEFEGKL